ncbi:PKD domain-containing protein, partial [Candidatus Gracilibacteria bacterium]|nr:PKD domain-containing protein [Candidatus Gracilibacteria bacterium]
YRWDYGDGTTSTSSGTTSHSYRDNGSYTVTLTVIDASGNVARSSVVVVIGTGPIVGATRSLGNICLDKKSKSQGLLIGTPNCTQCPCANTISISSSLRSCDIVFPTILSPTLDTVYSRGGFYLIP